MYLYNSATHKKEEFRTHTPGHVEMYTCGPTVYHFAHIGNLRSYIMEDVLEKYLRYVGYDVNRVMNITDVGHLTSDADEGEDKIAKKARLEQLEPMEVAQYYTDRYHDAMRALNVLPPSIEPRASGHIIEQIEMTKAILEKGFAYVSNGSVYFDVEAYDRKYRYGKLSGRVLDEMQANTRTLDGQGDKRGPFDFALWKKASKEHIMRWPSPWSDGFPGWHMECSAMSTRYLGETFDIHGGGMDLMFPHHECEIAQSTAACGHDSARYWMHNNLITINGQKMGKSLGNFITLEELTTGRHKLLEQAYSPMTIRFFILQAHYRGTLDFSNEALQAAEKGYERLMKAVATLPKLKPSAVSTVDVSDVERRCVAAMDDDLNTPVVISVLFDCVRTINQIYDGHRTISEADLKELARVVRLFVFDILGLRDDLAGDNSQMLASVVDMVLDIRQQAKAAKDWATSDRIRDGLASVGIRVKDRKDGYDWETE